jgi:hypothetical protein
MSLLERIHQIKNRATPDQMLIYNHSILLHKLYNGNLPSLELLTLNFNQTLTSRQTVYLASKVDRVQAPN